MFTPQINCFALKADSKISLCKVLNALVNDRINHGFLCIGILPLRYSMFSIGIINQFNKNKFFLYSYHILLGQNTPDNVLNEKIGMRNWMVKTF